MNFWNIIDNSRTLKEAFISVSIQHGQNEVGTHFFNIYKQLIKYKMALTKENIISMVYNYRRNRFPGFSNRYERECSLVMDMLRLENEKQNCNITQGL